MNKCFLAASHVFIISMCDNSLWLNHCGVVIIIMWNVLGTGDQRQEIHLISQLTGVIVPEVHTSLWIRDFFTNEFPSIFKFEGKIVYCNSDLENYANTCHGNTNVLPRTKYDRDRFVRIWLRAETNYRRICIMMKISLVKWGPIVSVWVDLKLNDIPLQLLILISFIFPPWCCHGVETLSALPAFFAGIPPTSKRYLCQQKPVKLSCDVFFVVSVFKLGRWNEALMFTWRHSSIANRHRLNDFVVTPSPSNCPLNSVNRTDFKIW